MQKKKRDPARTNNKDAATIIIIMKCNGRAIDTIEGVSAVVSFL